MSVNPSHTEIDTWTEEGPRAPVAVYLRERLMPVEGHGAPIFPATYAVRDGRSPYNIDALADGTRVASIDSVGSQANRIEPIFKDEPYAALVPRIEITYGNEKRVSILDAGHRLGDAVIRCTELSEGAKEAFETFLNSGNASAIAKLAPTSLVFGVWDSRGTQAKLPRIVQSVIRAYEVSELTRSAQYNPPLDYAALGVFLEAEREKQEGKSGTPLAVRGFVHVPAVGTHGGVIAHGAIRRDVTLNLVALRRLHGDDVLALRRYILGLALVGATAPQDGFLRAGCLLVRDPDHDPMFEIVARDGTRQALALAHQDAFDYARSAAERFGVGEDKNVAFEKERAKKDAEADKKSKGKKGQPAEAAEPSEERESS